MDLELNKKTECDVSDIISQQVKNDYFNRMDIVIRYLAIENFFEQNDFGFFLYGKMYKGLFRERSDKSIAVRRKTFEKLIVKVKEGNFNTNRHPVRMSRNLNIWDGSHRIACAIYFSHDKVFVLRCSKEFRRTHDLGEKRLSKLFSEKEWNLINEKKVEIFDKLNIT